MRIVEVMEDHVGLQFVRAFALPVQWEPYKWALRRIPPQWLEHTDVASLCAHVPVFVGLLTVAGATSDSNRQQMGGPQGNGVAWPVVPSTPSGGNGGGSSETGPRFNLLRDAGGYTVEPVKNQSQQTIFQQLRGFRSAVAGEMQSVLVTGGESPFPDLVLFQATVSSPAQNGSPRYFTLALVPALSSSPHF